MLPLFIFDTDILDDLGDHKDRRVQFIHHCLHQLDNELRSFGSSLLVKYGQPTEIFKELAEAFPIEGVFTNHDYEPYAVRRDTQVEKLLQSKNISFHHFKDHVVFEDQEVLKSNSTPYTVYTPYSRQWKATLTASVLDSYPNKKYFSNFLQTPPFPFPSLKSIGFEETSMEIPGMKISMEFLRNYSKTRNIPSLPGTSRLSVHLRFGTVSIREVIRQAKKYSEAFLNELIWREFYFMILQHFPGSVTKCFKPEYERIPWRNNQKEFQLWCMEKLDFQSWMPACGN